MYNCYNTKTWQKNVKIRIWGKGRFLLIAQSIMMTFGPNWF